MNVGTNMQQEKRHQSGLMFAPSNADIHPAKSSKTDSKFGIFSM
jgi:hypothetical protein